MSGTGSRGPAVLALALLALALTFGPALIDHARLAADPHFFNDDVRQQIFPFFRDLPDGPVGPDLLGQYQLDLMPIGFSGLYRVLEPFVDPAPLSKALPYILLAPLLVGIALAARAIGGGTAAIMSLALALQTPVFLERMMGGMPRAFAFPLLALGLWAAATLRLRLLAGLVVIGQALYAVPAAILGLTLAGLLLLPGMDWWPIERWPLQRRVMMLAVVGAAAVALTIPIVVRTRPWGRMLGPDDVSRYAEMGEGGRYALVDRVPATRLPGRAAFEALRQPLAQGLTGGGTPLAFDFRQSGQANTLITVLLMLLAAGLLPLARRSLAARRALIVPAAAMTGYVLAFLFSPYLYVPQRYALYALPLCAVVFLPACGGALATAVAPARWQSRARAAGACAAAGLSLVLLGGRGDPRAGYTMSVAPDVSLYDFIHSLPRDVLVAGWPDGTVNNVPYLSRRRAFVTTENHMAFHEGYVLEMRRRVQILIRAFYGTDLVALDELRRDFGVTHVIVDADDLRVRPRYFAPFTAEIEQAWAASSPEGFALQAVMDHATVFSENGTVVLDLAKVGR